MARGAQANKSLLATCEVTCEGGKMIFISNRDWHSGRIILFGWLKVWGPIDLKMGQLISQAWYITHIKQYMPGLHIWGNVTRDNSDWKSIWGSMDWLVRLSKNRRCFRIGLGDDIIPYAWPRYSEIKNIILFPVKICAWSVLRRGLREHGPIRIERGKEADDALFGGKRWSLIHRDSTEREDRVHVSKYFFLS